MNWILMDFLLIPLRHSLRKLCSFCSTCRCLYGRSSRTLSHWYFCWWCSYRAWCSGRCRWWRRWWTWYGCLSCRFIIPRWSSRDRCTATSRAHMRVHLMSFSSWISAEMVLVIVWYKVRILNPIAYVGFVSIARVLSSKWVHYIVVLAGTPFAVTHNCAPSGGRLVSSWWARILAIINHRLIVMIRWVIVYTIISYWSLQHSNSRCSTSHLRYDHYLIDAPWIVNNRFWGQAYDQCHVWQIELTSSCKNPYRSQIAV
jgi:hypothetical protein